MPETVLLLIEQSVPYAQVEHDARELFDEGCSVITARLDDSVAKRNPTAYASFIKGLEAFVKGERVGQAVDTIGIIGFKTFDDHPVAAKLLRLLVATKFPD